MSQYKKNLVTEEISKRRALIRSIGDSYSLLLGFTASAVESGGCWRFLNPAVTWLSNN